MTRRGDLAQAHLRDLRKKLRITQHELAAASKPLSGPISREFIANLESAGLPGTVRKFLTYCWLTGADLPLVTEMSILGAASHDRVLATPEALQQCRELSEKGKHRLALSTAMLSAQAAGREGKTDEQGVLLLAAAVAAQRAGYWRLAREAAESAQCCKGMRRQDQARAILVIAQSLNSLDREELALAMMTAIDPILFEEDPQLGANYWHDRAVILRSVGDLPAALEAAAHSMEYYEKVSELAGHAKVVALSALMLAETSDFDRALQMAKEAVNMVLCTDDKPCMTWVMLTAGRVHSIVGSIEQARPWLEKARDMAREIQREPLELEARLALCNLLWQEGDRATAKSQLRQLRQDAARLRVDKLVRKDLQALADRL